MKMDQKYKASSIPWQGERRARTPPDTSWETQQLFVFGLSVAITSTTYSSNVTLKSLKFI